MKLTIEQIRELGFEWPRLQVVEDNLIVQDGLVDLDGMIAKLESSRAFFRKQLNDAYKFKQQSGADYSDFTDRFDEYAKGEREMNAGLAFLAEIVKAGG